MKATPIRWIADAGHAWLQVRIDTCEGLNISHYSYQSGQYAYLEEDCDAPAWLRAHGYDAQRVFGIKYTHINGDWIGRRKYQRYTQKVKA